MGVRQQNILLLHAWLSHGAVISHMATFHLRFWRDESGTTAIEYSLIAGLVAVVIAVALKGIGQQLLPKYQGAANGLS